MIAAYQESQSTGRYDFDAELPPPVTLFWKYIDRCDMARWLDAFDSLSRGDGIWADCVNGIISFMEDPLPPNTAVLRDGRLVLPPRLPYVIDRQATTYDVFVAGTPHAPGTVSTHEVSFQSPVLHVQGHQATAAEPIESSRLLLRADDISRWTVVDDRGGAWFPEGVLIKYDAHRQPYFYGDEVEIDVPTSDLTVRVSRGPEYRTVSHSARPAAGEVLTMDLSLERIENDARRGWYSADLHVHLNFIGGQICSPADAMAAQAGEGLDLMNVQAANAWGATVYEREAFEHYAGRQVEGVDGRLLTWGYEYRNDMFGHFHTLMPEEPPAIYHTGHAGSDQPHDWPPNAVAAREAKEHAATVGYAHPVFWPISDDVNPAFEPHRARLPVARELVADAVLGLVDSVDIGQPAHIDGAEHLYHRLLGCGLKLAATAGTDAILSHKRGWFQANQPGLYRCYAYLGEDRLSVEAWREAMRAGRTFVTSGPWLELEVDGRMVGDTVDIAGPGKVRATVRCQGDDVEYVSIVGPGGTLATVEVGRGQELTTLTADVHVAQPSWLAAVARGGTVQTWVGEQPQAYAHTSPVWVTFQGQAVANPQDALWCVDWLDKFEQLAREEGSFAEPKQLEDLVEILDQARYKYRSIATRRDMTG
ncbi:CehA/McbA family metallohydrolase (plasmid) [Rhodococcus sp. D-6]|uniref:CehA/McbA family metallohydrolase n=2 Tax=Rhodococcus sp. D-6 TaxID=1387842 RepID=A0AAU7V5S6_9NOCA